jgi:hypothetical protein
METVKEISSTLTTLRLFRENVVNEGSAKLLDKYDSLIKRVAEKEAPLPKISGVDTLFALVGLSIICAVFIAPWVYGLYKIFG